MTQERKTKTPVVIVGGFMSSASDYRIWQTRLQTEPFNRKVFIANINRLSWLGSPDSSFRPQLQAVEAAVKTALQSTGAEKVTLVCHSAGGRLARLWAGEKPYGDSSFGGRKYVRRLIFLGVPYLNNEPWSRRSTTFANTHYPGAFYPEIDYISVIGKAVYARPNGSIEERLAFQNYRTQLPQKPQQWGDGIVPIEGAFVPGAVNLVLEGIYHGSLLGRPGYENPNALNQWGKYLGD